MEFHFYTSKSALGFSRVPFSKTLSGAVEQKIQDFRSEKIRLPVELVGEISVSIVGSF